MFDDSKEAFCIFIQIASYSNRFFHPPCIPFMRRSGSFVFEADNQKNKLLQELSNCISNLFIYYNIELHSSIDSPTSFVVSEWESNIYSLIECLKKIFSHGIRERKKKFSNLFDRRRSFNSIPKESATESCSFWPFVKEISIKATIELIELLSNDNGYFHCDEGKEIAWLIQILNDGFLLQNFSIIRSNQALVK